MPDLTPQTMSDGHGDDPGPLLRRVTAVSGGGYRDSIDAHCDSDNDCDDDPLPNQLVQATPTKETYSPRAETNTQQQESPPPTPPRVQNLNLTTEEGLDTFMDLFAWSENKMSLDICSIPQKGAVSDSFCNVRLTIQTGLARTSSGSTRVSLQLEMPCLLLPSLKSPLPGLLSVLVISGLKLVRSPTVQTMQSLSHLFPPLPCTAPQNIVLLLRILRRVLPHLLLRATGCATEVSCVP